MRCHGIASSHVQDEQMSRIILVSTLTLLWLPVLAWAFEDSWVGTVWLNTFVPYSLIPAHLLLGWAIRSKSPRVAACCLPLIAMHLALILSQMGGIPEHKKGTSEGTMWMSANLMMGPPPAEAIQTHDPDLVLFQEFTPRSASASAKLRQHYPFRIEVPRTDAFGMAVFSKYPLSETKVLESTEANIPLIVATVTIDGKPIKLINVHTTPPLNQNYLQTWKGIFADVHAQLSQTEGAIVIAGDFNATQFSKQHRSLLSAGLESAHEAVGMGLSSTFPNGTLPIPPIRLDHMFLSPELHCQSLVHGRTTSSDHKPILAKLALTP